MNFDFYTSNRIIFGPGKFEEITHLVEQGIKRCFVVTGKSATREAGMLDCLDVALRRESDELEIFSVDREPTVYGIGRQSRRNPLAPGIISL